MDKKELRKQLELALLKSIEETVSKLNPKVGVAMRKNNHKHSKDIAKKFYKTLKNLSEKKEAPVKKTIKKAVKKKPAKPLKKAISKKAKSAKK